MNASASSAQPAGSGGGPESGPVFDDRPSGEEAVVRSSLERLEAGERLVALLRPDAAVPPLSTYQWDAVIDEAVRHKVAPLLYDRLRGRADVPPEAAARLRDTYARFALRAALLQRELSAVLAVVATRSIPCIALKGIALVLDTYAEPALRSMADIDLLVPRDRLADAERALLEGGWGSEPRPDIAAYTSWCHHIAPLNRPGGPHVEIHWTIERPSSPFRIDIEGVWARSRVSAGDPRTRVPAPEDLLLHACLHAAYHHRFDRAALKHLSDVGALLARHGEGIDFELLTRLSNESGAGTFVYCTLRLAHELLGVPIPSGALDALDRTGDEEAIVRAARNYILTPPEPLPSAYDQLAGQRTLRDRATLVGSTVFPGRAVIRRVHDLPEDSWRWVAFAALRPLDLLVRRGWIGARILFRSRALRPVLRREVDRRAIYRWVDEANAAGSGGLPVR